jgi:NADH-quinone oxidoreductase subunit C
MDCTQIVARITEKFGPAILASFPQDKHPRVHVAAEHWRALAEFLRHDPALHFDWLSCLTAVDYVAENKLAVVYDLYSTTAEHWFAVKVYTDRANPHVPSVMDIWPAADWHEREAFDMMGITFDGHNDLRRILLPEDWVGFPLRKDYVFPREYHGIPGSYEMDWQQQPDYPH